MLGSCGPLNNGWGKNFLSSDGTIAGIFPQGTSSSSNGDAGTNGSDSQGLGMAMV